MYIHTLYIRCMSNRVIGRGGRGELISPTELLFFKLKYLLNPVKLLSGSVRLRPKVN